MNKPSVAIAVYLDWPGLRHVGLMAGISQWIEEHPGSWDIHFDERIIGRPVRNLGRYAGVIARATPALARAAQREGVPVVNVWQNSPVADTLSNVFPDWAEGGRMAANFFHARGFLSLACMFPRDDAAMTEMAAAFCQAARDAALNPPPAFATSYAESDYQGSVTAFNRFTKKFRQWVATLPRPVGLLAAFPGCTARYLCDELRYLGLRVPEDIALITACHEPAFCDVFTPTLSGINFPFAKVGYEAAGLIDTLMNAPAEPPTTIRVAPNGILARDSTSVFPVDDDLVRSVLHHVEANLDKPLHPASLAARMHVTRRTLDRRFHAACGRSVSDVIRTLRIEKARQLLATTDLLLKQIALKVGIRHTAKLHRLFQQNYGVSPSEYRRQVGRPSGADTQAIAPPTVTRHQRAGSQRGRS